MSFFRESAEQARERAAATVPAPRRPAVAPAAAPAVAADTVWRRSGLPAAGAEVGVPFGEGVTSVVAGSLAYIPIALFTGFVAANYVVAAVAVVVLSYVLWSRRVVVGDDWLAVRKFGPYRVVRRAGLGEKGLRASSHGGVLVIATQDGRAMRLRRVEYTSPAVNQALRALVLGTGHRYGDHVRELLDLPYREDWGHYRYLADAFD